ncbi:MAG: carbohydrate ABC transporter permease [Anaerolineales bacterium]|nr:carbohydrate ABC transporter permease [Anaerolineales bacterium]
MATFSSTIKAQLSKRRRPFRWSRLFIYLFLGLFCLGSICAFVWIFMISLKTTEEFLTTSPWSLPKEFHFENYANAWTKANIGSFFRNSVLLATSGATVSVLISAMAAYVIGRIPFKRNGFVAGYFLIGYMVPSMLTIIPLWFTMVKLGINNGMIPLLLIYITSGIPFNTFILRGFFESLPSELEEAATVDGASPFRVFWQIMLPLSLPGLASTFLINFLSLWNEFFLALIFLRKANATLPLGLFYLSQRAAYSAKWSDLFAAILIVSVPVLIVFALLQKQVTRGMTAGAIKG